MSEAGSLLLRQKDNGPDCRGMLHGKDKSRGVVVISTSVASCLLVMSDLVGGVMAVVGVAAEGERYGECKLTEDAVMLLCQSARNVTVLRELPVADWLRVLQATIKGDGNAELQRAVRIENMQGRPEECPLAITAERQADGQRGRDGHVGGAAGRGVGRLRQAVQASRGGRAGRDAG